MELLKLVVDEAYIVVPALWIIAQFLKRTPKIKRWTIPWILTVVGISCTVFILGFSAQAFIQGVLVTGAAVYGHQLIKQTIEK